MSCREVCRRAGVTSQFIQDLGAQERIALRQLSGRRGRIDVRMDALPIIEAEWRAKGPVFSRFIPPAGFLTLTQLSFAARGYRTYGKVCGECHREPGGGPPRWRKVTVDRNGHNLIVALADVRAYLLEHVGMPPVQVEERIGEIVAEHAKHRKPEPPAAPAVEPTPVAADIGPRRRGEAIVAEFRALRASVDALREAVDRLQEAFTTG
jgi:hypothetical protein